MLQNSTLHEFTTCLNRGSFVKTRKMVQQIEKSLEKINEIIDNRLSILTFFILFRTAKIFVFFRCFDMNTKPEVEKSVP